MATIIRRSIYTYCVLLALFSLTLSLTMFSCSGGLDKFKSGLGFASSIDYQKVLDRYSRPKDSLKRKAAEFLILNLHSHSGYYGNDLDSLADVFRIIDTLSYKNEQVEDYIKNKVLDSILLKNGRIEDPRNKETNDDKKVGMEYLINDIEFAYKAWQKAPWKNKVAFPDFCEYILPYRVRNEQVEIWRPQTFKTYMEVVKNAPHPDSLQSVFEFVKGKVESEAKLNGYFGQAYPFTQNFSNAVKGNIGACETTTSLAVDILRSVGIPAALDYIPHWGNNNNRNHYVVRLIEKIRKKGLFSNENGPVSTWGIVDFSSDYSKERHLFKDDEVPNGMYIQYIKTVPKVYRHTFSEDPLLKDINKTVSKKFISPEFSETNLKDVTEEYMTSSTRLVVIPKAYEKYKVAYLCVFERNGWQPVAISGINSNSAFFDKVGNYVVYLPAVYESGKFIPVSVPFYLDSLNLIHEFEQTSSKVKNIHLLRKAPMYSYTAYHTESLKGGRFEGANNKDFKDAKVLYRIEKYPFYVNEVKISVREKFRYLRYVAPPGAKFEADNIAELQFYGSQSNKPLSGAYLGNSGNWGHEIGKAFDNDLDSYYENASFKDGWIGIDAGKSQRVSIIKFCPRNDTNCIIPGNEYELFYWDHAWKSLGVKKAKTFNLDFAKVPENALLWLKCSTSGKEERIFSFSKGMQQWW